MGNQSRLKAAQATEPASPSRLTHRSDKGK